MVRSGVRSQAESGTRESESKTGQRVSQEASTRRQAGSDYWEIGIMHQMTDSNQIAKLRTN